jgi:iron complex transport system permease protein
VKTTNRLIAIYCIAGVISLALVLLAFGIGQFPIAPADVPALLVQKIFGSGTPTQSSAAIVMFDIRAPRIAAAFVVGAALAGAGAAYQNLFRNPLVSPDILGVSSGAALGAVIGIIAALPWFITQGLAFAGGLAAVALIFSIGHRLRTQDPVLALVLTGVVVGSLLGAGVSLAKFLADPFNKLPAITFWLMGSFASVTGRDAWFVTLAAGAAAIPLFLLRWRINLLALPDDEARTLGLNVPRTRMWVVVAATLMTAASVAVCGIIGWVGLVVPHAIRLLIGGEFSRLLPLSMIAGGCFMLLIDTIARGATSLEIPPGVLTALIGAPVFIALLATSTRRRA